MSGVRRRAFTQPLQSVKSSAAAPKQNRKLEMHAAVGPDGCGDGVTVGRRSATTSTTTIQRAIHTSPVPPPAVTVPRKPCGSTTDVGLARSARGVRITKISGRCKSAIPSVTSSRRRCVAKVVRCPCRIYRDSVIIITRPFIMIMTI